MAVDVSCASRHSYWRRRTENALLKLQPNIATWRQGIIKHFNVRNFRGVFEYCNDGCTGAHKKHADILQEKCLPCYCELSPLNAPNPSQALDATHCLIYRPRTISVSRPAGSEFPLWHMEQLLCENPSVHVRHFTSQNRCGYEIMRPV